MSKHFKNLFNLLDKLNQTYAKAEEGASVVDDELSLTSENPVQNKVVTGAIGTVSQAKAAKSDIAPTFSDLTNYFKNDLVYYNGDLYEFQYDHTAGPWETSEVIQKDLSDIISGLGGGGGAEVVYSSSVTSPSMTYYDVIDDIHRTVTFEAGKTYQLAIGSDTFVQGGTGVFLKTTVDPSGIITLGLSATDGVAMYGTTNVTGDAMGYATDDPIIIYKLPY
jgi:hypothetical protein